MEQRDNRAEAPIYLRLDAGTVREDSRTVDVVASTEALDSHGTIVKQNWSLDAFHAAGGPVLWAHDARSIPIANATAKVTGAKKAGTRRLEATIRFPEAGKFPRSDEVFDAIRAGLVRMVSVGFIPHSRKWETEDDREFLVLDDNELRELSVVPVGSNPEALAKVRERALAELRESLSAAPPVAEPTDIETETIMADKITTTDIEARIASLQSDHSRILAACEVDSVEKALGAIEAGKAAQVELAKAQAEIEAQRKAAEETERAALVAKLEQERRITPAQRDGFCKAVSLETLKAFAETAPVIVAKSEHREAQGSVGGGDAVTHNGKTFAELKPIERAALKTSDPDLYEQLRAESGLTRSRVTRAAVQAK